MMMPYQVHISSYTAAATAQGVQISNPLVMETFRRRGKTRRFQTSPSWQRGPSSKPINSVDIVLPPRQAVLAMAE